ncbi:MAG TPA: zf-HC2 domain-containing protein [Tissierellaceae bacterium]
MKVTCNIVKDLLPLYVENLTSEDTRKIVEEHIENCQDCRRELESMKNYKEIPIDTNMEPFKKIEKKLFKNKVETIVFTALLVLIFSIIALAYLTAPEYLPYSSSIVSLKEYEDGKIVITFSEEVAGYDINKYEDSYSLTAWNTALNKYVLKNKRQSIVLNPDGEEVKSVYYYNADGTGDVLIYGVSPYNFGGQKTLPRLVLGYYVAMALFVVALCGILILIFKKHENLKNFLKKVILFPISYIISHICLKGLTTTSYSSQRDFLGILLLTVPIYCILTIGISVYKRLKGGVY